MAGRIRACGVRRSGRGHCARPWFRQPITRASGVRCVTPACEKMVSVLYGRPGVPKRTGRGEDRARGDASSAAERVLNKCGASWRGETRERRGGNRCHGPLRVRRLRTPEPRNRPGRVSLRVERRGLFRGWKAVSVLERRGVEAALALTRESSTVENAVVWNNEVRPTALAEGGRRDRPSPSGATAGRGCEVFAEHPPVMGRAG